MTTHKDSVHYKIKKYQCCECPQNFSRKDSLTKHKLKTHVEEESLIRNAMKQIRLVEVRVKRFNIIAKPLQIRVKRIIIAKPVEEIEEIEEIDEIDEVNEPVEEIEEIEEIDEVNEEEEYEIDFDLDLGEDENKDIDLW